MDEYFDLLTLAKHADTVASLARVDSIGHAANASCGDECRVEVMIDDGQLVGLSCAVSGCMVSRAAAGILARQSGVSTEEILTWTGETVRAFLGIPVSPLRERCLTVALSALHDALRHYESSC